MMDKFTKADLKDGMVVEYKEGGRRLVVANMLIGEDGFLTLDSFRENLESIEFAEEHTIAKIYKVKEGRSFKYILEDCNLDLIWERKETKRMTAEEMRKKLEELTGEKIEVEPTREEMIGKLKLYCAGRSACSKCVLSDMSPRCDYWKFDSEKLKQCYGKVMENGNN